MSYQRHCPVMSRLSSNLAPESGITSAEARSDDHFDQTLPDPSANKCPFLSKERDSVKEASLAVKEDVINLADAPNQQGTFHYEDFFHEQIMRKKKDHSYRYICQRFNE